MVTQTQDVTELSINVAEGRMRVLKGGKGAPLLVLPTDIGSLGWLPFHDQLAGRFTVYVASHPGFDGSDVPDWARNARDLAAMQQWVLKALGLGTVPVVGLGFGGWIAAEMATLCHVRFSRLVLAGAAGVKPPEGEILDQFLTSSTEYVRAGFHDQAAFTRFFGAEPGLDQLEAWELNREMASRVAWSPHMHNPALPQLLPGVDTPALLVWGAEDRVVPPSAGRRYAELLPNARLELIAGAGHFLDLEQPDELARLVADFVATG
jgi:pimeloyl-ACP methyl ester carboxylesterase